MTERKSSHGFSISFIIQSINQGGILFMNNVFILNKIFDGSWNELEGNISHEVIDGC